MPTAEEQAVMDALAKITGQLQEFTKRMEARRKPVVEAPPWLVDRMAELKARTPPTLEEVETQMRFSAAMTHCLDQGLTYDEAKDYIEACADDIRAGIQTPWRKKVGENRYQGECGCIFSSKGERLRRCGDHKSG